MLAQGYNGIKTGITDAAGPCLATSQKVQLKSNQQAHIIIVLLNCKTVDIRWDETKILSSWVQQRYFS